MTKEQREEKYLNMRKETFLRKIAAAQEKRKKNRKAALHRYWLKNRVSVKEERLKERMANGDKEGVFSIVVVRNKKRVRKIETFKWYLDAYKKFTEIWEENNKDVVCPKLFRKTNNVNNEKVKYELLLVQTIDPLFEDNTVYLQNEMGKYIETNVVDCENLKILDKKPWKIEEEFYILDNDNNLYRDNAKHIINDILLSFNYNSFTIKRIYRYGNKIIIKSDFDLYVIICRNVRETIELSNILYKHIPPKSTTIFYYSQPISKTSKIIDEIMEKTNWSGAFMLKGNKFDINK